MEFHNEHHKSIRRYLLGDLSQRELEQVEQLVMSDNDVYEELLFAEDDLIDGYLSGALSEEDRTKFKKRFLTLPELRQSVSFASALRKHALATAPPVVAAEPESPGPASERLRRFFMQPTFAVSFVAVVLAALTLNAWLFRQNSLLKRKVAQLQAQTTPGTVPLQEELALARQRNEQLSAELLTQQQLLAEESRKLQLAQEQKTPDRSGSGVLAVSLPSGFMRDSGGEWKKFSLQPDTREVSLRLDVAGGDYRSYEAVLQTIEGESKWSRQDLKLQTGNLVTFKVPSRILIPGDYRVVLNGINSSGSTESGSYYFRVLK